MITLADIQSNTLDDIQAGVIDEFRKSSYLFQQMPFDAAVSPGTSAGTLTYGYTRLKTQPTATTRNFNDEYTPQMVTKERHLVDLAVWGGAFEIDRVFATLGGLVDEVTLQTTQKVKASVAKFNDLTIHGKASDAEAEMPAFDGLDAALTDSSTEYGAETVTDWTGVESQADAFKVAEQIGEWLELLDGEPTAILANSDAINRLRHIARIASSFTQTQDAFGAKIDTFADIPLVDLGERSGSTENVILTEEREVGAEAVSGLTDLYAARIAEDGFHGVSLRDPAQLVQTYLDEFQPGYEASGGIRRGEVEMVAAVALKATKAAGVFRNVKVA